MGASKKKQGVKRERNTAGFARKMKYENLQGRMEREKEYAGAMALFYAKVHTEEEILIALKRMGILGPKRIHQLDEMLDKVRQEYDALNSEDRESGVYLDIAQTQFDEELMEIVGAENFEPWEVRMNPVLRSYGIRCMDVHRQRMEREKEEARKAEALEALKSKNGGCI